jgi:hypothetical protein
MHSRSPIQVGPNTPGNDTLAPTACEIDRVFVRPLHGINYLNISRKGSKLYLTISLAGA